MSRRRHPRGFIAVALVALFVAFPGAAGSASGDQITITLFASDGDQTGYQALIANFERVGSALRNNVIGLITGQATIDGILSAMDAAWKLGPA